MTGEQALEVAFEQLGSLNEGLTQLEFVAADVADDGFSIALGVIRRSITSAGARLTVLRQTEGTGSNPPRTAGAFREEEV